MSQAVKIMLLRTTSVLFIALAVVLVLNNKDNSTDIPQCVIPEEMDNMSSLALYDVAESGDNMAWYILGTRFDESFTKTHDKIYYIAASNAYRYAYKRGLSCAAAKKGQYPVIEELSKCVKKDADCMYTQALFDDYIKDDTKQLLINAANMKNDNASKRLAEYYADMGSLETAAVNDNNSDLMLWAGRTYQHNGDRANAAKWYEKSAAAGNIEAMLALQAFYNNIDCNLSGIWAAKAADTGNVIAQITLFTGYDLMADGHYVCADNHMKKGLENIILKHVERLDPYAIYYMWQYTNAMGYTNEADIYLHMFRTITGMEVVDFIDRSY